MRLRAVVVRADNGTGGGDVRVRAAVRARSHGQHHNLVDRQSRRMREARVGRIETVILIGVVRATAVLVVGVVGRRVGRVPTTLDGQPLAFFSGERILTNCPSSSMC